ELVRVRWAICLQHLQVIDTERSPIDSFAEPAPSAASQDWTVSITATTDRDSHSDRTRISLCVPSKDTDERPNNAARRPSKPCAWAASWTATRISTIWLSQLEASSPPARLRSA